jgi:pantoate--beta-alanine ligase
MKISQSISSLRNTIEQWRNQKQTIGFVPTMGHLHAGHIELINQARRHCDKVVVSIFVNPLQFNDASDLDAYPKTLKADQQKLITAQTDLLFMPDSHMMYCAGQTATSIVSVPEITRELEGQHRPGHFDGVSTVVCKLFNLVQPQQAFFGEKDYQQLLLVKKMVADLNMPIAIHGVATYREEDGLAMSSRNSRLSMEQRTHAAQFYQVLLKVSEYLINTEKGMQDIESEAMRELENRGFEPEYVAIRDRSNLKPPAEQSRNRLVLAAVKLGDVRLIDNLIID